MSAWARLALKNLPGLALGFVIFPGSGHKDTRAAVSAALKGLAPRSAVRFSVFSGHRKVLREIAATCGYDHPFPALVTAGGRNGGGGDASVGCRWGFPPALFPSDTLRFAAFGLISAKWL